MGSSFSKMKKQARQFEAQIEQLQEELKKIEVTGVVGNGLVEVTLNGDKELKKIKIKPECIDKEDSEALEDLILSACQDGYKKLLESIPEQGRLPFGF